MIQIIMLWYASISGCECNADFTVLSQPGGTLSVGNDQGPSQSALLQLVGIAWIFIHVFGGIIRSMLYIEPYYDIPDDPDKPMWKIVLFEKCGP